MPARAALPAYWLQGGPRQAGAPLVLLHGFLGSGADWLRPASRLERNWLAPDLPGHGQNPQPDCDFAAMAAGIWRDLDRAGIDRIQLMGYSMGARLALYMLCQQPERILRCGLESGSPGLADAQERAERRASDEGLARRLEQGPLEDFLHSWYAQPLFTGLRHSEGFAELLQRRRSNRPEGLAASLRQAGTGTAPECWNRLASLQRPLLVLAGRDDPKYRAIGTRMAQACPGLQLRILPGGHCLHHESPAAWAQAVEAFFGTGETTPHCG